MIGSFGNVYTTTTDANGNYLFTDLPAATYKLYVSKPTIPDGWNTTPTFDPDGTLDV